MGPGSAFGWRCSSCSWHRASTRHGSPVACSATRSTSGRWGSPSARSRSASSASRTSAQTPGRTSTWPPPLTTTLSIALGITALLTIAAFIDHNAHLMNVSRLLDGVTRETCAGVSASWPSAPRHHPTTAIDPPGAGEEMDHRAREAFHVGASRTMQQDMTFGIRQLVDVALRALSPGVNDTTTAVDVLHHLVAVLVEMLSQGTPARAAAGDEGRRLQRDPVDAATLVALSFDEVRDAAKGQTRVYAELLDALDTLRSVVGERPGVTAALEAQADAVLATATHADLAAPDAARVTAAYQRTFG